MDILQRNIWEGIIRLYTFLVSLGWNEKCSDHREVATYSGLSSNIDMALKNTILNSKVH